MTTDLAQAQFKKGIKPCSMLSSMQVLKRGGAVLELSREAGFIDGTADIFDVLARHNAHEKTLACSLSATIALLRRAGLLLREAERTIEAQKEDLRKMEALSSTDEISGLLNRRGFLRAFSRDLARIKRGMHEGGLLAMFNFENLDRIRKYYGGEAASMAVRLLAQALKSESRDMDYTARVADDEFVLLFADTTMEKALSRLQHMALQLNKLSLIRDGAEIPVHLSLGLKSYGPQDKAVDIFHAASEDLLRNRKGASCVQSA